jgi:hypothetical protein
MGGFRVSREKRTTEDDHDHHENEYDITLQPLDYANTPLRQHAPTPTRRYADTPIRRYADTPIRFPTMPGDEHQLRSAIYRPILTLMTPCSRCRLASALQTARPEWQAYVHDLGGMRRSPLTRVGQLNNLS